MNWKFWNKANIKGENNLRRQSILNQPKRSAEKIDDQLAHHGNRIDELEKQMSRTARIQYKSSQQLSEVISQIDKRTAGLSEITAINQKNSLIIDRRQQRLDSMAEALINCLNDIDM